MLYSEKTFIYFSQADLAGITYFNHFFDMAHRTLENFIRKSSLGWDFWFNNASFAVPIKNTSCDYFAPLISGQEYEIQLHCLETTGNSVKFRFIFYDRNQRSCAELHSTHVFIDKLERKKVDIPELIVDLLSH